MQASVRVGPQKVHVLSWLKTVAYVTAWKLTNNTNVPRIMPTSPMTFITNALRAASTAERRWYQKPVRKHDLRTTNANPMIRKRKYRATTSRRIANTKLYLKGKKRPYPRPPFVATKTTA